MFALFLTFTPTTTVATNLFVNYYFTNLFGGIGMKAGVSSWKITLCFTSYKEEDEACHVFVSQQLNLTFKSAMHASNWKMKNLAIPRFLPSCMYVHCLLKSIMDYTTSCEFFNCRNKIVTLLTEQNQSLGIPPFLMSWLAVLHISK